MEVTVMKEGLFILTHPQKQETERVCRATQGNMELVRRPREGGVDTGKSHYCSFWESTGKVGSTGLGLMSWRILVGSGA